MGASAKVKLVLHPSWPLLILVWLILPCSQGPKCQNTPRPFPGLSLCSLCPSKRTPTQAPGATCSCFGLQPLYKWLLIG